MLQSKEEDGTPRMIFISTKGFSIMYTDPRTGEAIESGCKGLGVGICSVSRYLSVCIMSHDTASKR